jgi:hypothetical protein
MWREVDGEIIVLDKRSWTYLGINGSGATLWKEIAQGASSDALVQALRREHGASEQVAARDVEAFISMLQAHGLLAGAAV